MASGKSNSVTLQSLLPDRAYKVILSAIHYTGESESMSTTGRTGKCISTCMFFITFHPSVSRQSLPGQQCPCLHWARAGFCSAGQTTSLEKGKFCLNFCTPPPNYLQFQDDREGLVTARVSSQASPSWITELTCALLSLSAPALSKFPSVRGFVPSKPEGKSPPIKSCFGFFSITNRTVWALQGRQEWVCHFLTDASGDCPRTARNHTTS